MDEFIISCRHYNDIWKQVFKDTLSEFCSLKSKLDRPNSLFFYEKKTKTLYHQLHRDSDACLGRDLADLEKKMTH